MAGDVDTDIGVTTARVVVSGPAGDSRWTEATCLRRPLLWDLLRSLRSSAVIRRERRKCCRPRRIAQAVGYHDRDDRASLESRRGRFAAPEGYPGALRRPLDCPSMIAPPTDLRSAIAQAVSTYEASGNMGVLMEHLHSLRQGATGDALVHAVEPWREMPEVAGPIYEKVVEEQPTNARALVILANAYWLSGRGPEVVGVLADRAIAADPANRGAWHMWALTEGNQRDRTIRWMQVTQRFPDDQLAKAALADNASSLASAEQDKEAMQLAIATYEELLALATSDQQKQALETALTTLRKWTM